MKTIGLTWMLMTLVVSSSVSDSSFTLILLPDTQTCAEEHPEILDAQTGWIAEHAGDVAFVLQQGDMTDDNTADQWKNVAGAFARLDGKVDYTFVPGNHDTGDSGRANVRDTHLFNKYFPYDKYSKKTSFGGAFETGKMDNTWHTFTAGGRKWLILSLEFGPRNSVIDWAAGIVQDHPDHLVIINTHAYLYSDDQRLSPVHKHKWTPQSYGVGKATGSEAVNDGEEIWQKLAGKYPNIFFVFCGHVLNDGTGKLVSTGENGNKVYQMLANYQGGVEGSVNGGNGYLRILRINVVDSTISVKTYSPYLDRFKTEDDQEFTFKGVDFSQ